MQHLSSYHHWCCEFSIRARCDFYACHHFVELFDIEEHKMVTNIKIKKRYSNAWVILFELKLTSYFGFLFPLNNVVFFYIFVYIFPSKNHSSSSAATKLTLTSNTDVWITILLFMFLFICLMVLKRHFQKYFSYIVAVSFPGGGNPRTRKKTPTWRKSLTNFIA